MLETLLAYVIGPLVGAFAAKHLGARKWQSVKKNARAMLSDETNPTVDPRAALEQAIIAENSKRISADVEKMQREWEAGKLRIAAAQRGEYGSK